MLTGRKGEILHMYVFFMYNILFNIYNIINSKIMNIIILIYIFILLHIIYRYIYIDILICINSNILYIY